MAVASAQAALDSALAAQSVCSSSSSSNELCSRWRELQSAGSASLLKARGAYEGARDAAAAVKRTIFAFVQAARDAEQAAATRAAFLTARLSLQAHPSSARRPSSSQAAGLQRAGSVLQAQDVGTYLLAWHMRMCLQARLPGIPPSLVPLQLTLMDDDKLLLLLVWVAGKAEGSGGGSGGGSAGGCAAVARAVGGCTVKQVQHLELFIMQQVMPGGLYEGYRQFLQELGLVGLGLGC